MSARGDAELADGRAVGGAEGAVMRARPIGVPIFIVLGMVVWGAVTIGALAVIVPAPAENAGLAMGLALMWSAFIAFAVIERWTGGRKPG